MPYKALAANLQKKATTTTSDPPLIHPTFYRKVKQRNILSRGLQLVFNMVELRVVPTHVVKN